jgi:hypothetical protein
MSEPTKVIDLMEALKASLRRGCGCCFHERGAHGSAPDDSACGVRGCACRRFVSETPATDESDRG